MAESPAKFFAGAAGSNAINKKTVQASMSAAVGKARPPGAQRRRRMQPVPRLAKGGKVCPTCGQGVCSKGSHDAAFAKALRGGR